MAWRLVDLPGPSPKSPRVGACSVVADEASMPAFSCACLAAKMVRFPFAWMLLKSARVLSVTIELRILETPKTFDLWVEYGA